MLKEFKEFAVRGNAVDMAVGIIIGAAFGTIVQSLVNDIIMPPIGILLGDVDFADLFILIREGADPAPYASLAAAREAGAVVIAYGQFINTVLSFLIVAFAVFLVIRYINRLKRPEATPEPVAPSLRKCPYCLTDISIEASRCPNCTSEITPAVTVASS